MYSIAASRVAMSLLRDIHQHGQLLPPSDLATQFSARSLFGGDYGDSSYGLCERLQPTTVAHRCEGGFDAVHIPSMLRAAGPFSTQPEAEEAAAIARMERRAERIEAEAIKAMARRAAEIKEECE